MKWLIARLKKTKRRLMRWLAIQLSYAQEEIRDNRRQTLPPELETGAGTLIEPVFEADVRLGPRDRRIFVGSKTVLACKITLERDSGTVSIGDNTYIGSSHIICAKQISIGSDVMIAWGCTIIDHDAHSPIWEERANDIRRWREGLLKGGFIQATALKDWSVVAAAPVCIKDKAWIGFNTIIMKGVTIGEGAVVGSGSVITKDVPDWSLAAGNPARVIKSLPRS